MTLGIDFSSWWTSGVVVGLWLGFVLGLAEWLSRHDSRRLALSHRINPEIPRKIVHIGTGNVILLAWWLKTPTMLGILASIVFCFVTLASYRFEVLSSLKGVGRQSWGTFFYALSIGVLILIFWTQSLPHFAVIGVLCMAWGDGMAALIGQNFGVHKYQLWGMQKSWEGSFTMFLVSALSTSMVLWIVYPDAWVVLGIALLVALSATVLEAFSKYGLDNLTVPLGSAWVSVGLLSMFQP